METTSLVLNVKSDTVERGADRLDHLARSSVVAERASKGLATSQTASSVATGRAATATGGLATAQAGATTSTRALTGATAGLGVTMAKTLAPVAALLAPLLAFKKLLGSTVELQNYQAQLKTATGSIENAGIAFEVLEDFASTTPFALEQSLEAFIKLTNLGLTPSERALTSYGNTASAMGKDLNQLIEAVADAATGEFERLKEFGIKTKSEGDNVTFTFRGVATTVKKEAGAIEEYLTRLGENEFAGSMSDRMNTVGGQMSNLGDLWNQLFRTVSEMGVGSVIGEGLAIAIDFLDEFISQLKSGQFESSIQSWTSVFEPWAEDFENTLDFLGEFVGDIFGSMGVDGAEAWEVIVDTARVMPAAIRAIVQRVSTEITLLVAAGVAAGKGIYGGIIDGLNRARDAAIKIIKSIGEAITDPVETFRTGGANIKNAFVEGFGDIRSTVSDSLDGITSELNAIGRARREMRDDIESELLGTIRQSNALQDESRKLRQAYESEKAAKDAARAQEEDRLARFGIAGNGGQGASGSSSPSSRASTASQTASEISKAVFAQASRYGFTGDPYQNFGATSRGSSYENIGNRSNRLVQGVSVALTPELAKELGVDLKAGEFVEAFIDGVWKEFRVDDTTARGLSSTAGGSRRIDFFDPTGERIGTDGTNVQVRKAGTGGASNNSATREFADLTDSLLSQEDAIEQSYLRRLQLIRDNTEAGSAIRAELEEKELERYESELSALSEKNFRELEIEGDKYDQAIDQLNGYFEQRKEIFQVAYENELISEQEKNERIAELTREQNQVVAALQLEQMQKTFANYSTLLDMTGNLVDGLATLGKEGTTAQKILFGASKAISIAQAIINTELAATRAMAEGGFVLGIPMATAIRALGYASVGVMAGQAVAGVGNFATGGILGGQSSTGDAVTFNGNRGEMILNFEQQRRLLNIANGGASVGQGGGSGNITIINQTSTPVEAETRVNANGDREIIIREAVNRTKAELANEANTGGGSVVPALQRNFGLRRTGTN